MKYALVLTRFALVILCYTCHAKSRSFLKVFFHVRNKLYFFSNQNFPFFFFTYKKMLFPRICFSQRPTSGKQARPSIRLPFTCLYRKTLHGSLQYAANSTWWIKSNYPNIVPVCVRVQTIPNRYQFTRSTIAQEEWAAESQFYVCLGKYATANA